MQIEIEDLIPVRAAVAARAETFQPLHELLTWVGEHSETAALFLIVSAIWGLVLYTALISPGLP